MCVADDHDMRIEQLLLTFDVYDVLEDAGGVNIWMPITMKKMLMVYVGDED